MLRTPCRIGAAGTGTSDPVGGALVARAAGFGLCPGVGCPHQNDNRSFLLVTKHFSRG